MTGLGTLLDALIEVERTYKQTLSRAEEHEIQKSVRRIRFMEKMRTMAQGSSANLDDAEEATLKLDIEFLAERPWNANDVGELIHRYHDVEPHP